MCVLSIKVSIRKKFGNLSNDPRILNLRLLNEYLVDDILNKQELIYLYKIKWFRVLLSMLYVYLLIHAEIYIYVLDTYRRNDNRRSNKRRNDKDARRQTQEDFFNKIYTSHFIARVRKGCSRFACERVLETEHKLHILTPLLWPSRCVFLVLLDAQPEVLGSTPSGLFRGPPRSGVAFPTTSRL